MAIWKPSPAAVLRGAHESCPRNPILTHRDTALDQFQAVGHADLVDTPDGELWAVFHGIRTTQYMLHHIGRGNYAGASLSG